ncbi:FecR family protein [Flavobacterium pectinovorum]|uniref:FecR family protein n=1 Tax=Flavobacterium pectinovorum TaxID=29533 RepID=UPI001FAD58BB|nr:FecR family protein [Flavobacterium pectinovorum]MCI9844599.1 FecR family protein [Flavobacterium pectinovorum]
MKTVNFSQLMLKYLARELTPEESVKFEEYLTQEKYQKEFRSQVRLEKHTIEFLYNEETKKMDKAHKDKIFEIIKSGEKKPRFFINLKWISYAAGVAAVLAISFTLFYKKSETALIIDDNKITLSVPEESVKEITKEGKISFKTKSGVKVVQNGDTLSFNKTNLNTKLVYDEMFVPRGKNFVLKLSDGTVVIINSSTKIKFPENFTAGVNREVFVEGEAYFKVAKNAESPFIVHSDNLNIRVLGTEFNVNSYGDKGADKTETVLVEGSVGLYYNKLSYSRGEYEKMGPGMKVDFNHKNLVFNKEKNVDLEKYISWVNGEVIFDKEPLEDIIKVLERKFNVDFEVRNKKLLKQKFVAKFKEENIYQVMAAMQLSFPFKYKIENNKIIIE